MADIVIKSEDLARCGENIRFQSGGNLIILVIDTSKGGRPSKTGKMDLFATTGGFAALDNGFKLNLNLGK